MTSMLLLTATRSGSGASDGETSSDRGAGVASEAEGAVLTVELDPTLR